MGCGDYAVATHVYTLTTEGSTLVFITLSGWIIVVNCPFYFSTSPDLRFKEQIVGVLYIWRQNAHISNDA
jgi:hypothetical protein